MPPALGYLVPWIPMAQSTQCGFKGRKEVKADPEHSAENCSVKDSQRTTFPSRRMEFFPKPGPAVKLSKLSAGQVKRETRLSGEHAPGEEDCAGSWPCHPLGCGPLSGLWAQGTAWRRVDLLGCDFFFTFPPWVSCFMSCRAEPATELQAPAWFRPSLWF